MGKLIEHKGNTFEVLEPVFSTRLALDGDVLQNHFKVGDRVRVIPWLVTNTDGDFDYHILGARMLIDVYGGESYTIADILPERVESKGRSRYGDDTGVMYKLMGCGDHLF